MQRQLLRLLSALDRDGINVPDATSYRILQYNPPYTLPWLRRNELLVNVGGLMPGEAKEMVDGVVDGIVEVVSEGAGMGDGKEEGEGEGSGEGEDDGSQPSDY